MKTKIFFLMLFTQLAFSQVGIATTAPTATLDVNGSLRVRGQLEGTVQTDNQGNQSAYPYKVVSIGNFSKGGTIQKAFNVLTITQTVAGTYLITLQTPMLGNNYVVSAISNGRYCRVDNMTANSFELSVSSNTGLYNVQFIVFDML